MTWELKEVSDTKWIQDDSGYYTLIHYIKENCRKCNKACVDCVDGQVRIDIMGIADSINPADYPVMSFQGIASNVRKTAVRFMAGFGGFSHEHAAYIGAELARCELLKTDYVQD